MERLREREILFVQEPAGGADDHSSSTRSYPRDHGSHGAVPSMQMPMPAPLPPLMGGLPPPGSALLSTDVRK
eukprot:4262319-Amphidinium_carterae.1